MKRTCSLFCVLPIAFLQIVSQTPPTLPNTLLHGNTNAPRKIVDVVVTDKNNHPVTGLSEKDFRITEDGKPQSISSFEAHTAVGDADGTSQGPVSVILVSLLSTAPEDRSLARQQLIKFMEQKPAGSRFAIFTYGNSVLRLRQGLTDDKDKLLEALNRKSTKPKQPSAGEVRVNSDPVYKWDDPFDALTDVVRQVADIPGRKNLIWLSDGFSDATPAFTGNLLLQNRIAVYTIKTKAAKTTKSQISTSDCETEFDPGYDPNVGVPEGLNMGPAAARAPSVTSTCASPPVWNFGSNKGDLAKNSGGQAFTGTDNIDVAINRAIADSSNYYTIGYVPTNAKYVGKARKIKVVLANNGYRLLYRQSY